MSITDQHLRLECLRLAMPANRATANLATAMNRATADHETDALRQVLSTAEAYYRFVCGQQLTPEWQSWIEAVVRGAFVTDPEPQQSPAPRHPSRRSGRSRHSGPKRRKGTSK